MQTIKSLSNTYRPKLVNISRSHQLDIEVILSFVIKKSKEFLYTYPEYKLNKKELKQFKNLINRRLKSEPISYIVGKKEFYGLDFIVNKNTLIPRPETEIIIENVLKKIIKPSALIDIGTGTGCIPISIAKNLSKDIFKKTDIYCTDISSKTLNITKKNLKKHKLYNKIKLIKGDLLDKKILNFIKKTALSNIIITANLPYITTKEYKTLSKDIQNFEPKLALTAGVDGLKYYKKLFKQIKKILLNNTISLLIEINPNQVQPIKKFLNSNFSNIKIETIKDLANLNRIMVIDF